MLSISPPLSVASLFLLRKSNENNGTFTSKHILPCNETTRGSVFYVWIISYKSTPEEEKAEEDKCRIACTSYLRFREVA